MYPRYQVAVALYEKARTFRIRLIYVEAVVFPFDSRAPLQLACLQVIGYTALEVGALTTFDQGLSSNWVELGLLGEGDDIPDRKSASL